MRWLGIWGLLKKESYLSRKVSVGGEERWLPHCQETHAHGHPRGHPHMLGFPPHQISRQPWLSQMVFAIIM